MEERINHSNISKDLIFLEVFCEEITAISDLSDGYNQEIPPGKFESVLDRPCRLELYQPPRMLDAMQIRTVHRYARFGGPFLGGAFA